MSEVKEFSAEIHEDLFSIMSKRCSDRKVRISFRRYDGTIRYDTSLKMSEEAARALRDTLSDMIAKIDGGSGDE
jgi:hypothetical protein